MCKAFYRFLGVNDAWRIVWRIHDHALRVFDYKFIQFFKIYLKIFFISGYDFKLSAAHFSKAAVFGEKRRQSNEFRICVCGKRAENGSQSGGGAAANVKIGRLGVYAELFFELFCKRVSQLVASGRGSISVHLKRRKGKHFPIRFVKLFRRGNAGIPERKIANILFAYDRGALPSVFEKFAYRRTAAAELVCFFIYHLQNLFSMQL